MRVLQEDIETVVGRRQKCALEECFKQSRRLINWNCVEILVQYICLFHDSEAMSVRWHCLAIQRPRSASFLAVEETICSQIADDKPLRKQR